ncbi:MAG: hypothetical protein L0154_26520 [Chloroflexi bacterium]|nr:hypothetical protein [Chloroflexota bacterium]
MPVVDDLTEAIAKFADGLTYDVIKFLAEALWWMIKAAILLAYQIFTLDSWLSDTLFPPLIETANSGTRLAASLTFFVALLLVGLTYLMAVWIKLDVVNPRQAFVWFLAGSLFFQLGPQIYQSFHTMRTEMSYAFFASGLAGVSDQGDTPFTAFAGVNDTDPLVPYDLCDNYGPYFAPTEPVHNRVRGTDVALAFLRAQGYDVMGYGAPYPSAGGGVCGVGPFTQRELPQWWLDNPWVLGGYFYAERDSSSFDDYGPNGRRDSIENAFLGLRRLVASIPLVAMGITESLIYLLLTLAEGMVFLSAGIAIVFSYFRRTEIIALSVIDQMVQLIVQSLVIALLQSLIMGVTFAAASTPNPFLLLGMGSLSLVLMLILLWSGVRAVFGSINGLFQSIGAVTGGRFITPTQAAVGAAGVAAGGTLLAAGGGLLGAAALSQMGQRAAADDPRTFASRALRGSSGMFRASVYAAAAGTGNQRLAQLGHFSMMLHHTQASMSTPPTAAQPQPANTTPATLTIPQEPATEPRPVHNPVPSASNAPQPPLHPRPSTLPESPVPMKPPVNPLTEPTQVSQRTQPIPLPRLRQTIEDVGEELEDEIRHGTRPAAKPSASPQQQSTLPDITALRTLLQQGHSLGLTRPQMQQVVRAVHTQGQLQPQQLNVLLRHAGRHMPADQAQQRVNSFIQTAQALPAAARQSITVKPMVTVQPTVTVQAPATSSETQHKRREAAALQGSHRLPTKGE